MPPDGFVIAMRGRLSIIATHGRRREMNDATLVVSRFNDGGAMLAIGLAGATVTNPPPAILMPRLTLLARGLPPGAARAGALFRLLADDVPALRLAGRSRGATGAARITGDMPLLRLGAAGRLNAGARWRIDARQIPWIGESATGHCPASGMGLIISTACCSWIV